MKTRRTHGIRNRRTMLVAAVVLAGALACDASGAGDDTAIAAMEGMRDTADMGGMGGMTGMGMAGGMSTEMRAHMQMMDDVGMDSLPGLMPAHRQMVANMLAQMNREMSDMNMEADSAWTETVDSLRDDLRKMRAMDRRALAALMPAHRARVLRLADMHQSMMPTMTR